MRNYKKLDSVFSDHEECYKYYVSADKNKIEEKIKESHFADSDSILGTYYRINPELKSPDFYHKCTWKPIELLLRIIEVARTIDVLYYKTSMARTA